MLINYTDHLKTPKNFRGTQKGIVVYNDDPRRLGRVKCVIAGLLEGRLGDLPWIFPWTGGASTASADGYVPEIGSVLAIEYKFDDIYSGFYTGAWKSYDTASGFYNESYPDVRGSRDESGNTTSIDKAKGLTSWTHSSGTNVKFDSAGNLIATLAGQIQLVSASGKALGLLDMSTGEITLTAEATTLNGRAVTISPENLAVSVGTLDETVQGNRTSQVLGGASDTVAGSYSRSVAGNRAETVAGESNNLYAGPVSNTLALGQADTIAAGGLIQTILAGGRTLNVALGDVSYVLGAGSYSVKAVAGDITLETLVGNFKISNTTSSMSMDPSGGISVQATSMFSIDSVGPVSIQSSASIDLVAPLIGLNKAAGGMVLTTLTQPVLDSITGTPSIGVPTVLAG